MKKIIVQEKNFHLNMLVSYHHLIFFKINLDFPNTEHFIILNRGTGKYPKSFTSLKEAST